MIKINHFDISQKSSFVIIFVWQIVCNQNIKMILPGAGQLQACLHFVVLKNITLRCNSKNMGY